MSTEFEFLRGKTIHKKFAQTANPKYNVQLAMWHTTGTHGPPQNAKITTTTKQH